MHVYYDRSGRYRGASTGPLGLAVGGWLWVLALPVSIPLYYLPREIARSGLSPRVKLGAIAGLFAGLLIIGVLASAHTAGQAQAAGCIPVASAPSGYLLPASDPCSVGYVPRVGCVTTVAGDAAAGTGGCGFAERPQVVGGP